jgi:crotonobetainyl-CoA:carnitine CoA-transferase CaiB-like acyl-CoA transferase
LFEETQSDRALQGIRVVDLSRVLAGPWATQLLADLGADVIKDERPGVGDDTRSWGPPRFDNGEGARESAYFTCANRGKRSIAIDIASPNGAAFVEGLVQEADILVENFKVGALSRYGLDYESLSARNPRLVYCSITGFGGDGPYAAMPGYDFIVQAMGGLMSLTGEADGPPTKVGVALTDIMTGLYACNGILAALHQRKQTGRGQKVETSLFDVQIAVLANQAAGFFATGRNPARHGNAHPSIVSYQSFVTADGLIAVAVGNDAQFLALCGVLGRPEYGVDPRFATNADRVTARESLVPILQALFMVCNTGEWLSKLIKACVPVGPVNNFSSVFEDAHVIARGIRIDMQRGSRGAIAGVACPIRLSGSPPLHDRGPPQLDEHGDVIRRGAGWSPPCALAKDETSARNSLRAVSLPPGSSRLNSSVRCSAT